MDNTEQMLNAILNRQISILALSDENVRKVLILAVRKIRTGR